MKLWLRPLPFALLGAYALSRVGHANVDDAAPSRSAALCAALVGEGVLCAAEDVVWIDGPKGVVSALFGASRALVRGRERAKELGPAREPGSSSSNDTFDIYAISTRLSPEGHLLDVGAVHNLTSTAGADEGTPVLRGSLAAYVVSVDGRPEAVHVLDLEGHDAHAYDDLSRFQRLQVRTADLQQTGQASGIKRTVFVLSPAPSRAELAFQADGNLEIRTESRTLVLDGRVSGPRAGALASGAPDVRVTPEVIAKPPTFAPWMSDRLRAVSWFGDEKNQALKAIVFTGLEWFKGLKTRVAGDTSAKDVAEDLGSVNAGKMVPDTFSDPEIGWPPRPLEPLLKSPLTGEGQWIALDKDPFITSIPGVPAPFSTTFVRTDPAAPQTRVYITLWDPRLVALHMEAGTVEPVSATGEAGPGLIPRTPEVMRRVVAGFNGGFQATHGEFGMQVNGVLYLPPKPYAATVMELRDGTTAFGAWPKDTEVPDDVLSFRQNMTPLVQNDKFNPWGRTWWGGVPPGWHDAVHTTRSGVCITKEGYVAYFYGSDIGPEPLGRAMLIARCALGIHLDMNPGLAGFEFYNVQPSRTFAPLGRPLQPDWEYEGSLKDMPDFKFRSRRMVKSMGHMLFPRYIHRDARDFFYLTARTVLPGAPIAAGPDEGAWRVKGLPQHGYPYAVATTSVHLGAPTDKRVRVLRIDPRTVRAESASEPRAPEIDAGAKADAPVVAVFGTRGRATEAHEGGRRGHHDAHDGGGAPPLEGPRLWLGPHVFVIEKTAPRDAVAIASVVPLTSPLAAEARSAVGISDEDGMLQWLELLPEDKPDAATAAQMLSLLERLGCSSRGLVLGDVRALLGGSLDIGGEPAVLASASVRLVRTSAPGARTYFDTEVVPQSVWFPLQERRVKWRPTLAPPDKPAASASASASGSSPSTSGGGPPK